MFNKLISIIKDHSFADIFGTLDIISNKLQYRVELVLFLLKN